MRQYTIFYPLFMAFYSRTLYQDVARYWRGMGLSYLGLLLVVTWIPLMGLIYYGVRTTVDMYGPGLADQIPQITIDKGVLSIDKPTPYVIKDPINGYPYIIIDTSGRYTDPTNTPAIAVITANYIAFKSGYDQKIKVYQFKQTTSLQFGKEEVSKLLHWVKRWLFPILFPLVITISFFYRLIQGLIYAVVGLGISRLFKAALSYKQCLRLTIIALTPSIVVATLLGLLQVHAPYQGLLLWLLPIGYLFYAVYVNSPYCVDEDF